MRNAFTLRPDAKGLRGIKALRQPFGTYLVVMILGLAPTAFVLRYYGILSNRTVIRWDMFGNTTIIGTRPQTVLTIAYVAAAIAVLSVLIGLWQNRSLVGLGIRRAYFGLNLAQIVAIDLTCAMIVSDALGLQLTLKPTIAPAMAVVLFAGGVLCWRLAQGPSGLVRMAGVALSLGGIALLGFSAIAAHAVVGYYAGAFSLLAMAAVALPQSAN